MNGKHQVERRVPRRRYRRGSPSKNRRQVVRPGDYPFIPANVLHVAVNRGDEPAVFIGSRNEPTPQESVVLRPEMDARVP